MGTRGQRFIGHYYNVLNGTLMGINANPKKTADGMSTLRHGHARVVEQFRHFRIRDVVTVYDSGDVGIGAVDGKASICQDLLLHPVEVL
jgi:hypothetical protein